MPDTFGYCAQLPQIMKKSGIDYFVTQKLSWNLINKFPHTSFYWQGIDSTKVLTHFPPADTYNSNASVSDMYKSLSNNKDLERTKISLMLFGHGDGGGGPKYEMLEMINRMEDLDGIPKVIKQPIHQFFQQLEETSSDLCTWNGELYLELHRGTYTTQALIKRYNRLCELLLRDCEIIWSLCKINFQEKIKYPKDLLEKLWKKLLLNQFHDVLPGTSIGLVYKDSLRHYHKIQRISNDLITKGEFNLLKNVTDVVENVTDDNYHHDFFAFNTLSWNRKDIISFNKLPSNYDDILIQKNSDDNFLSAISLNAFSFSNSFLLKSEFNENEYCSVSFCENENVYTLENQFIITKINENGQIISFYQKQAERELIIDSNYGNRFVIFDDVPCFWDAWDIMIYHLESRKEIKKSNISMKIEEIGPLRASISISFSFGNNNQSSIYQKISLSSFSPILSFETKANWRENRKLLKVEFPTDIISTFGTYEIQFGYVQRSSHFNTSWDLAKFEVCGHKWADYSEFDFGLSILNDSKYSYSIRDGIITLTLLKSPKAPDENCDQGEHNFTYGMYVHGGSFQQSKVIQKAYELNVPIRLYNSLQSNSIEKFTQNSFFSISGDNIILDSVKIAEDNHCALILRFYEAYGGACNARVTFNFIVKDIYSCNLLEDELEKIDLNHEENSTIIHLQFCTFEIKTIRIYL